MDTSLRRARGAEQRRRPSKKQTKKRPATYTMPASTATSTTTRSASTTGERRRGEPQPSSKKGARTPVSTTPRPAPATATAPARTPSTATARRKGRRSKITSSAKTTPRTSTTASPSGPASASRRGQPRNVARRTPLRPPSSTNSASESLIATPPASAPSPYSYRDSMRQERGARAATPKKASILSRRGDTSYARTSNRAALPSGRREGKGAASHKATSRSRSSDRGSSEPATKKARRGRGHKGSAGKARNSRRDESPTVEDEVFLYSFGHGRATSSITDIDIAATLVDRTLDSILENVSNAIVLNALKDIAGELHYGLTDISDLVQESRVVQRGITKSNASAADMREELLGIKGDQAQCQQEVNALRREHEKASEQRKAIEGAHEYLTALESALMSSQTGRKEDRYEKGTDYVVLDAAFDVLTATAALKASNNALEHILSA